MINVSAFVNLLYMFEFYKMKGKGKCYFYYI